MPPFSIAEPSVFAFVVLPVLLVALFVWGVAAACRKAGETPDRVRRVTAVAIVGAAIWLAATWGAASRGVLLDWDRTPPPFAFLVAAIFVLAGVIAFGPIGSRLARHIPLWVLIGVQAFRFPLELAMHRLSERGIMPDQMSYSGRNFDILTGITAIVIAALLQSGRGTRMLVLAWNVIGLGLLLNIVTIAILSTPRFAAFGPDRLNTFVMYPPFVWLPAIMVLAALTGHLLIFRKALTQ